MLFSTIAITFAATLVREAAAAPTPPSASLPVVASQLMETSTGCVTKLCAGAPRKARNIFSFSPRITSSRQLLTDFDLVSPQTSESDGAVTLAVCDFGDDSCSSAGSSRPESPVLSSSASFSSGSEWEDDSEGPWGSEDVSHLTTPAKADQKVVAGDAPSTWKHQSFSLGESVSLDLSDAGEGQMLQDDPAGSIRLSPVTCGTSKSCTGASRPSYFRSIRDMADDIEEGVDSLKLTFDEDNDLEIPELDLGDLSPIRCSRVGSCVAASRPSLWKSIRDSEDITEGVSPRKLNFEIEE